MPSFSDGPSELVPESVAVQGEAGGVADGLDRAALRLARAGAGAHVGINIQGCMRFGQMYACMDVECGARMHESDFLA